MEDKNLKPTAASSRAGTLNFSKGNNFYIYGDIDYTIPENIIAPMIEYIDRKKDLKDPGDINIYVSSYGGYVQYGFDLISQMEQAKDLGFSVNTYVTSVACSCGSLIAVAGSKRYVSERAYHLLHFMRGSDYAHNPIMSDRNNENAKFWQKQLVDIYKKYTRLKNIEKLLLPDNYMINGASQLIRHGLADYKM